MRRHTDVDPPPRVPAALRYPADPIEALTRFLAAAREAMTAEGIDEPTRRRVVNRLVWGHPDGYIDKPVPADPPARVLDDVEILSVGLAPGAAGPVAKVVVRDTATGSRYTVLGGPIEVVPRTEGDG